MPEQSNHGLLPDQFTSTDNDEMPQSCSYTLNVDVAHSVAQTSVNDSVPSETMDVNPMAQSTRSPIAQPSTSHHRHKLTSQRSHHQSSSTRAMIPVSSTNRLNRASSAAATSSGSLWLISLMLMFYYLTSGIADARRMVTCDSCFAQCPEGTVDDPSLCDCKNSTCTGDFCFAKVELWSYEGVAGIQKGCVSHTPGNKLGCFYAGTKESIECFCDQPYCARPAPLNGYAVAALPTVECCMCEPDETKKKTQRPATFPKYACGRGNTCADSCEGEYCLADFRRGEQGCGYGYPRLWVFLRTDSFDNAQKSATCTRYESGIKEPNWGCVCTDGEDCNDLQKTADYDKEHRVEGDVPLTFCYSLASIQKNPVIKDDVFDRAETCQGHYCFIELTSSQISLTLTDPHAAAEYDSAAYEVELITRYELLAGCISIDDAAKVKTGCTAEYMHDNGIPNRKHCICDGHMCNYFYQLTRDNMDNISSLFTVDKMHAEDADKVAYNQWKARQKAATSDEGEGVSIVPEGWQPPKPRASYNQPSIVENDDDPNAVLPAPKKQRNKGTRKGITPKSPVPFELPSDERVRVDVPSVTLEHVNITTTPFAPVIDADESDDYEDASEVSASSDDESMTVSLSLHNEPHLEETIDVKPIKLFDVQPYTQTDLPSAGESSMVLQTKQPTPVDYSDASVMNNDFTVPMEAIYPLESKLPMTTTEPTVLSIYSQRQTDWNEWNAPGQMSISPSVPRTTTAFPPQTVTFPATSDPRRHHHLHDEWQSFESQPYQQDAHTRTRSQEWNSNGERIRPRARLFIEDVDESIDTYDQMPYQKLKPMVVSTARGPQQASLTITSLSAGIAIILAAIIN